MGEGLGYRVCATFFRVDAGQGRGSEEAGSKCRHKLHASKGNSEYKTVNSVYTLCAKLNEQER